MTRLVLFAHGSADSRWKRPFEELAASLQQTLGISAIRLAYMQFAEPTLSDVATEAARDGVGQLRVLPVFLAAGAHIERDVPQLVCEVQERYPQLDVVLLPPIGNDRRVAQLLRTLALEAATARPSLQVT